MRQVARAAFFFLSALALFAQTDRSTVTGTVSDPAGAVIPNAAIELRNPATGTIFNGGSSATGNFVFSVPTGIYELSVTVQGFKRYVRTNITVPVATSVRQDVNMEVGTTTETLTVTDVAPLLKTEGGDISHNIDYQRANSLPVLTLGGGGLGNVRNPLQVINLLPGASFQNENVLRVNGLPSNSQAIRIEGQDATNGIWRQLNQGTQAGLDAIQEVSIQTSNFAAEYGQAGGGYFNYTMKSGTNAYHGSGFDYVVFESLHAGTPFTDDNGTAEGGRHLRSKQRRQDFGFTFGGPVWLPKLYDGHDKTFFFLNFEQFRETQSVNNGLQTVPTAAYRIGDFSQALNTVNGAPRALTITTQGNIVAIDPLGNRVFENAVYDPRTTSVVNGLTVRSQFVNNIIPTSLLDPTAAKIQALLPQPRAGGNANAAEVVNNYSVPEYSNFRRTTIPSIKLDHNLSQSIKLSGFFTQTNTRSPNANGFTQIFTPVTPQDQRSNTTRINYDQTLTPTLLLHLGAGLVTTRLPSIPEQEVDQEKVLGLVGFYGNQFPNIGGLQGAANRGGTSIGMGPGAFGNQIQFEYKTTGNASITWVKDNHTYKFGSEMVIDGLPQVGYNRANGLWGFASEQTQTPWQNGRGLNASTGFNYASFFLGNSNSLNLTKQANIRLGNHALGFFMQDTWKVTKRLTVDYGVRYDYQTYLKEQYGRMQNAAFGTLNPSIGRNGSVIYEGNLPGRCQCAFGKNYPYAFGPRLSMAYQINEKTVLRAGYGMSYGTASNNAQLTLSVADFYTVNNGAYGESAVNFQQGNPYRAGNPYGNPELTWPNFDGGKYPFKTALGRPPQSPFIAIDRNAGRPPRIQQWSIGLQREVIRDLVLDVSYVGNRGTWFTAPLLADINANAIRPQDLGRSGLDITNAADRALLTTPMTSALVQQRGLANLPYADFPLGQNLNQSLRPYPQWLGVPPFLGPPLGNTWYDSLQVKVTKRYSNNFDVQSAFTWQKELTNGINSDTSYLTTAPPIINDVFNRAQNKQISGFSQPFQLVISFNYTTPKLTASGVGLKVLSWATRDWTLSGVLRYTSGALIRVPGSNNQLKTQLLANQNPQAGQTYYNRVAGQSYFVDGIDPNCKCFDPTQQLVQNPNAWVDADPGKFSTSAPYYNDYRWQRQPSEALNVGRVFRMGPEGKYSLQIRAEFQNVTNRLFLNAPAGATNPTAATNRNQTTAFRELTGGFGFVNYVNGAGSSPRRGQMVARFTF